MAILKDQYCLDKEILEAGIDEAGAGCFAAVRCVGRRLGGCLFELFN